MRGMYSAAMCFVHQKLFRCVADGWPLRFGIDDDAIRHFKICRLIHEDMTISRAGLNHRDRRILRDVRNKRRSAAGNQHVYQSARLDQFVNRIARA